VLGALPRLLEVYIMCCVVKPLKFAEVLSRALVMQVAAMRPEPAGKLGTRDAEPGRTYHRRSLGTKFRN
jgi:hypothetical protein